MAQQQPMAQTLMLWDWLGEDDSAAGEVASPNCCLAKLKDGLNLSLIGIIFIFRSLWTDGMIRLALSTLEKALFK